MSTDNNRARSADDDYDAFQEDLNVEQEKIKKWIALKEKNGGSFSALKKTDALKKLVRQGIPRAFRRELWMEFSGAKQKKDSFKKGHYTELLMKYENHESVHLAEIEQDVPRTFPNQKKYKTGEGREQLRRVLLAFSWHSSEIGYCQSLSYIAGLMLLFMEEEEVFWMLVAIVEDILPPNYYNTSMSGAFIDQQVFRGTIQKKLPRISALLDRFSDALAPLTLQWFTCLFVCTVPIETTLRVWDCLFFEGNKILFRVGLALLKMNEDNILKSNDMGDLSQSLRSFTLKAADTDTLIKTAFTSFGSFSKKLIANLRREHAAAMSGTEIGGGGLSPTHKGLTI